MLASLKQSELAQGSVVDGDESDESFTEREFQAMQMTKALEGRVSQLKEVLSTALREKAELREENAVLRRQLSCTTGSSRKVLGTVTEMQHELDQAQRMRQLLQSENDDLKIKLGEYKKMGLVSPGRAGALTSRTHSSMRLSGRGVCLQMTYFQS